MKVEHYVLFPEVMERDYGKVIFKLEYLDDYSADDLNIHLAMLLLESANLIPNYIINSYSVLKSDYLYNKTVDLVPERYTGPLADRFTELEIEKQKIMDNPDYALNMTALFNNYHFGDEIPENLPDVTDAREASFQLMQQQNRIMKQIEPMLSGKVKTTAWPRLANNRFDYSLPATLIFELYNYDSSLLPELNAKALEVVQQIDAKQAKNEFDENYWVFTVYSNKLLT